MKNHSILGINWEQNSTAALMIDGEIVGCCSEERFSRVKNDERYPINAINYLLKKYKVKIPNKVVFISKIWAPGYILTRHYTTFTIKDYIKEQNEIWFKRIFQKKKVAQTKVFENQIDLKQFPGKQFWIKVLKKSQKTNDHVSNSQMVNFGQNIRREVVKLHLNIDEKNIEFIDHSSGHLYYAFFSKQKKMKKNLSISLDAFGDNINYNAVIFYFKKGKFVTKEVIKGGNFIIGRLYRYVTLILGLKPNEHEYKVMGLSPYANPGYFKEILNFFLSLQVVKSVRFVFKKKPRDLYFSIKSKLDGNRFDNIAGALQSYCEILITNWLNKLIKKTKIKFIYFAGGVAMNVKNNMMLTNLKSVKKLYVPPSPDDSSQAMGACYVSYVNNNNLTPKPLKTAYLGYEIKNFKVKKLLKKIDQKKFKIYKKNINEQAAILLSKGLIIARAYGKAEFGARSLGNRSILSRPDLIENKDIINQKVKNRDFWMPFAASVNSNFAKKYFLLKNDLENYKFMTNCLGTNGLGKKVLKAAIHPKDFSCRPQIVFESDNFKYFDLIKRFSKITKIGALLNTSFNIHGFPIVNSEIEAFNVFKKTNLDGLILGDYLILKK
jgi:carbamoyltransferase